MATLRRELIQKFTKVLLDDWATWEKLGSSVYDAENIAEHLADVALESRKPQVDLAKADVSWAILAGVDITQAQLDDDQTQRNALESFERDMGLPKNWSWYPAKSSEEKAWKDLRDFVVAQYKKDSKCFQTYQTWRTQPFARGAMSNLAIRKNPENFPASWTDFLASNAMYGKKDAPEVKKDDNGITISYI